MMTEVGNRVLDATRVLYLYQCQHGWAGMETLGRAVEYNKI